MSLLQLEATFWEFVRGDRPPASSVGFVERGPLEAVRRLGIYHHAYFERQRGVLAELFPKLCALLGHDTFYRIATEYVKHRPSRTPIIERIGADFPGFLRDRAELGSVAVDLARLEWARVEAMLAADAPSAVSLADLARLDAAALRLVPAPSTRLLRVAASTLELWRDPASRCTEGPSQFALVVRVGDSVRHVALSACAGRAFELTLEGRSLARAFAEFSGADAVTDARDALATFVELRVWSGWEEPHVER